MIIMTIQNYILNSSQDCLLLSAQIEIQWLYNNILCHNWKQKMVWLLILICIHNQRQLSLLLQEQTIAITVKVHQ